MSVKSNYKDELELKLSMINEKATQINRLNYETELIKKDCVNIYHHRDIIELCEFVDIHSAWYEQPKKITHKIYKRQYLRNKYHWFMYWLQEKIFENVIWDIEFYDKLTLIGYGSLAICVPFKYKGVKFEIRIPNISVIDNFNDMLNHGFYVLLRKPSDHVNIEFANFYSCDEVKEKIKEALDKEIKDEPKGRKCDLKTVC